MSNEVQPVDAVQLWLAWKHANEHLRSAVIRDVGEHSELAEPERTVLIHLHAAGGSLRQNALTAATGWDRGRLSHLLTRMEARRLVQRARLNNGVDISITPVGEAAWTAAEASLRTALQHHIIERLEPEQLTHLFAVLSALSRDE